MRKTIGYAHEAKARTIVRLHAAEGGALARRRKRLVFRSWHRGTKELGLLLGPFADACLARLDASMLAEYEALLEQPEPDLFEWILERVAVPAGVPRRVLDAIVAFHRGRGGI